MTVKKTLLLVFIFFSSIFLALSQTIVSTAVTKKVAIFEEFTGMHCPRCPPGHKISNDITTANPNKFYVINLHQGPLARPSGSEPDYRSSFGDALATNAGVFGTPSGVINRRKFSTDPNATLAKTATNSWSGHVSTVIAEDSPVNIAIEATLKNKVLTVLVELYYTDPTAAANANTQNYLNIALLQDNLIGPQSGSSGNPSQVVASGYSHNHVLRDFITGQWGEVVTVKQGLVSVTKTYTISTTYNGLRTIPADLSVVAFISKEQKENILTGTKEKVKVTLSTNKLFSENTLFTVFPNPASNQVTLSLTQGGNNNPVAVKIFDITGRNVFESNTTAEKLRNYKINTQEFAQGIYFVEVSSENKNKITKLIIQ